MKSRSRSNCFSVAKRPKKTLLLEGKHLKVLEAPDPPPTCYGTWEPICANDDFCGEYFIPCRDLVRSRGNIPSASNPRRRDA